MESARLLSTNSFGFLFFIFLWMLSLLKGDWTDLWEIWLPEIRAWLGAVPAPEPLGGDGNGFGGE